MVRNWNRTVCDLSVRISCCTVVWPDSSSSASCSAALASDAASRSPASDQLGVRWPAPSPAAWPPWRRCGARPRPPPAPPARRGPGGSRRPPSSPMWRTRAPRLGSRVTSPSCSSRTSAVRTAPRDIEKPWLRSASTRREFGASSPRTMASRRGSVSGVGAHAPHHYPAGGWRAVLLTILVAMEGETIAERITSRVEAVGSMLRSADAARGPRRARRRHHLPRRVQAHRGRRGGPRGGHPGGRRAGRGHRRRVPPRPLHRLAVRGRRAAWATCPPPATTGTARTTCSTPTSGRSRASCAARGRWPRRSSCTCGRAPTSR